MFKSDQICAIILTPFVSNSISQDYKVLYRDNVKWWIDWLIKTFTFICKQMAKATWTFRKVWCQRTRAHVPYQNTTKSRHDVGNKKHLVPNTEHLPFEKARAIPMCEHDGLKHIPKYLRNPQHNVRPLDILEATTDHLLTCSLLSSKDINITYPFIIDRLRGVKQDITR